MPATHKMVVLNTASAICHVKLGAIAKKYGVMYALHTQFTIKSPSVITKILSCFGENGEVLIFHFTNDSSNPK